MVIEIVVVEFASTLKGLLAIDLGISSTLVFSRTKGSVINEPSIVYSRGIRVAFSCELPRAQDPVFPSAERTAVCVLGPSPGAVRGIAQ